MEHIKCRCKHCQKEYTYCTYGNGPDWGTEEGCSMDYCAECQKAIDNALAAIPKKYTWKLYEIRPTLGLLEALAETKEKGEKEKENSPWPCVTPIESYFSNYDNVDTYVRNGIFYQVCWDDETPEKKHVLVKMEYNIREKRFTDRLWKVGGADRYSHSRPFKWPSNYSSIKARQMEPPCGDLFFIDFPPYETTINMPKREPEHIKREYTRTYNGKVVKNILKGEDECRNGCPEIKINDIYDFFDYECSFEKYDDEETETMTGVKFK